MKLEALGVSDLSDEQLSRPDSSPAINGLDSSDGVTGLPFWRSVPVFIVVKRFRSVCKPDGT